MANTNNNFGILGRFFPWLAQSKKAQPDSSLMGSQRSLALTSVSLARNYDLEIPEYPIRDPATARVLIEMKTWCYEVRFGLSIAAKDTFASSDGDDQGWSIPDTLDDGETKVHPDVMTIATDLMQRKQGQEYVLGGDRLAKALQWSLMYGDCFLELGIERDGTGSYGIARSLYLPTWEMFRTETDTGILQSYEQRRSLSLKDDPAHTFAPPQIVHFRFEPNFLYGTSWYFQSIQYWAKLKDATENLAIAARDVGVNPNVHTLPDTYTQEQLQLYKSRYQNDRKDGLMVDLFLANGVTIQKLAQNNPDLSALIDTVQYFRSFMIPPSVPTYLFPGMATAGGTKELSREPARAYSRTRYGFCRLLTNGIKQAIDTEIILKKGYDWWEENGKYRVIWPEWTLDGMKTEIGEAILGQDELDSDVDENEAPHIAPEEQSDNAAAKKKAGAKPSPKKGQSLKN